MSFVPNGSKIKRKSNWKNLKLVYRPTIRHYRRRIADSNPKVNLDLHRIKTSNEQSISVQRQGTVIDRPPSELNMDHSLKYKVSSASLNLHRRPRGDWAVLAKHSLAPSSSHLLTSASVLAVTASPGSEGSHSCTVRGSVNTLGNVVTLTVTVARWEYS